MLDRLIIQQVIRTSPNDRKKLENAKLPGDYQFDYKKTMDNRAIMDMIIGEFKEWRKANKEATFKSMKVIMCTPRARLYPIKFIEATMQECLEMKQEEKYKNWIAGKLNHHPALTKQGANVSHTPKRTGTDSSQGFDFVGPEHEGRTLEELKDQFDKFKDEYKRVGLKWILHCGESFYDKDDRDKDGHLKEGNLKFALNHLDPHRLAHGYAIKNVKLSEAAKAKLRRCGIETCPTSNEILGLAYDARYAAVHYLKSQDIPCSVSCDNPTLFQ